MTNSLKSTAIRLLRKSEKYTKTDMVYLFQAGFWGNLNAFVIAFFSLLLYIAYAHFLTKENYGTYQYLLSWFSIATAFTLNGINSAVVRATARGYEGTLRASVLLQIKYGIIPLLGSAAAALYYWHGHNILLAESLLVIGFLAPLLYAFNTYGSFLIGKKDFRRSTMFGISSNFVYYALLALAAFVSGSPLVLLTVNLGSQVIVYAFLYYYVLRTYKPNHKVDEESLAYGMHLSAMGVFASVAGQLGNIFIFHFLGPVSLALYSFASAVPERLGSIFFKFLHNATLPKFAERTVAEVRVELMRKMLFAFIAGIAIAVVYALLAPLFFHTFFPAYNDAIPYTIVFGIGLAFAAVIYIPISALTALKHTRALYLYNILNPIVQIIFPLTGIWLGGLWGYLIAHILTVIFAVTLATILVYKSES